MVEKRGGIILNCDTQFDWKIKTIEEILSMREFLQAVQTHASHLYNKYSIRSSVFANCIGMNDEIIKWQLHLHPGSTAHGNKEKMAVYLKVLSGGPVIANVKISITNQDGMTFEDSMREKFENNTNDKSFLIDSSFVTDIKKRGPAFLIISCSVTFVSDATENDTLRAKDIKDPTEVCNNYQTLFDSKKFTDVTLIVEGKELRAHRAILSAQSPVFGAMFDHDMQESSSNTVEIKEIDYDVMEDFLRYLYSGNVDSIRTKAKELLIVADRYSVDSLKTKCEAVLVNNLTIKNVFEIMNLAEMYSKESLKPRVMEFLNSITRGLADTPESQDLMEKKLMKAFETMREAMNKYEDK